MSDIKKIKILDSSGNYNEYDITATKADKLGTEDVGNSLSPIYLSGGIPTSISLLDTIYPIGSIYFSVNNINPGTLLGGTWEAYGDEDSYLRLGGSGNGGSNSYSLTSANIPAHTHSVGAHAHGLNSHTHSVGAHSHGLNSHTHSVGAHSHGLNSHTHSIPALSGTAASAGAHRHHEFANQDGNGVCAGLSDTGTSTHVPFAYSYSGGTGYWLLGTSVDCTLGLSGSAGAHTHSVTTTASTSGKASGSTANSSSFNTGAASGSTANSSAFNSGAASGNTANSTAFNSGSYGSSTVTPVTVEPKYVQVYAWKRTA